MKFWPSLAVLLFLSVLTFADCDRSNEQTKEAMVRHKSKNSADTFVTSARSRRRRQLLDGRPPLQLLRGLRGLMNGFDVVLKSARNVDVLKCIPRFVCEMTAPIPGEGSAGSNDDAEASTTDAEGESTADEGEKDEETKDTDDKGHDEKEETGSHRAADPDVVRQVMQAMFQMPFALPSPFMPQPNPFLFTPFLNTVAPPAKAETEKTTEAPETTTKKSDKTPPEDEHSENEIPRLVRHVSSSQYYRPVVRPHNRYSSHRSIRPVSHIRTPIRQVRRPDNLIQTFQPPSPRSQPSLEPRKFTPQSHFRRGTQTAPNIVPFSSNRRFHGPNPIKRNDQVVGKDSSTNSKKVPQLNRDKWKAANATTYFDGERMRTIRRYVRVQNDDDSWLKRIFGRRRRRSTPDNGTTIEEIKNRVRRGIKDFIENAGVTAREIMGALERMEEADSGQGTTSSFYPGIRAGLLGYMGDPATCEEEFKDCPTSTGEVIKTYTDIRTYYPNGFTFRDRIPRPFRYLIP